MECSQLPAADKWEDASRWQLDEYRSHVKICRSCRRRVLLEAPHQLMFELSETELPEDFWIGFWDSLRKKLAEAVVQPSLPQSPFHSRMLRLVRWVAVLIAVGLLMINGRPIEEAPSKTSLVPVVSVSDNIEYPLIEDIQSPTATYYIFQPGKDEKIVMVFDPEMDL